MSASPRHLIKETAQIGQLSCVREREREREPRPTHTDREGKYLRARVNMLDLACAMREKRGNRLSRVSARLRACAGEKDEPLYMCVASPFANYACSFQRCLFSVSFFLSASSRARARTLYIYIYIYIYIIVATLLFPPARNRFSLSIPRVSRRARACQTNFYKYRALLIIYIYTPRR